MASSSDWDMQDALYERMQRHRQPVAGVGLSHATRPPSRACGAMHERLRLSAQFVNTTRLHLRAASIAETQRQAQEAARLQKCAGMPQHRVCTDPHSSWSQHEQLWQHIGRSKLPLSPNEVPWPPSTQGILTAMAMHEASLLVKAPQLHVRGGAQYSNQQQALMMKRAYHKATLRWHPDKFKARLQQQHVISGEVSAAVSRATSVFLAVNEEWQGWIKRHRPVAQAM